MSGSVPSCAFKPTAEEVARIIHTPSRGGFTQCRVGVESSLATVQFLQIAAVVGFPVLLASSLVGAPVCRNRKDLSWAKAALLFPVFFVISLSLQIAFWWLLPEMPESIFMFLGFANTPALLGGGLLLLVLWLLPIRPLREARR